MKMTNPRLALAFRSATDPKLLEIANTVLTMFFTSGNFPTPPVTAAVLEAAIQSLVTAIAARAQGGTIATMEKNLRRGELVDILNQLVWYAQFQGGLDTIKLASSGFALVTVNTSRTPLAKVTNLRVANGTEGQSLVSCEAPANTRSLELQAANIGPDGVTGEFVSRGIFTRSQRMPVDDLTPGVLVAFRARAIGGSTGYSDWSDVVVHRAA